jgi:hypothetical protein
VTECPNYWWIKCIRGVSEYPTYLCTRGISKHPRYPCTRGVSKHPRYRFVESVTQHSVLQCTLCVPHNAGWRRTEDVPEHLVKRYLNNVQVRISGFHCDQCGMRYPSSSLLPWTWNLYSGPKRRKPFSALGLYGIRTQNKIKIERTSDIWMKTYSIFLASNCTLRFQTSVKTWYNPRAPSH